MKVLQFPWCNGVVGSWQFSWKQEFCLWDDVHGAKGGEETQNIPPSPLVITRLDMSSPSQSRNDTSYRIPAFNPLFDRPTSNQTHFFIIKIIGKRPFPNLIHSSTTAATTSFAISISPQW
mmetsp:Transcript_17703/g.43650  ORF Transcript_17703/g.43650 Transcript_17703/m.43650 type:complete len:120 (+) Transcript_17703:818-1177(+)